MKITFLGGVGTVTGSKYLLETKTARILVDCGLFQGFKNLRLRNWAPLPVEPASIQAVILTHAHLDHSGYLPLLVKNGFAGEVICTEATRDLCDILLPDSGFLQEKDAEFANRHRFSKHKPALPLYTLKDAKEALDHFRPYPFGRDLEPVEGIRLRFLPAGHILGASIVEIAGEGMNIVFSGDLGRTDDAIMVDPAPVERADYLIVESTYGDRRHDSGDAQDTLADIVTRTIGRGGTIIVPAFAVGRAQSVMYHIRQLKDDGRIPGDLRVYLDSPMAIDASEVFCDHMAEHRLTVAQCRSACSVAKYVHDAEDSKALDSDPMPKIIISASGMATGGRVLHHLKHYAPDHRSTILFTGFQAGGTRGAAMVGGAEAVKIHGQYVQVKAEVDNLQMLSAHADADEIIGWLGQFRAQPRLTFVTHGEPAASDALRHRINEELNWQSRVPDYR
ncbi:MAG TPA: MBL fold metallo-hydrolase, partial [Alphaproteobacteria bacterium]|nr:MBL fold metallo-hydrolase [Alphaproteobacteria bacterium]